VIKNIRKMQRTLVRANPRLFVLLGPKKSRKAMIKIIRTIAKMARKI
jgi:hypothetical protein